jgi:hypothetical protein
MARLHLRSPPGVLYIVFKLKDLGRRVVHRYDSIGVTCALHLTMAGGWFNTKRRRSSTRVE